MFTRLSLCSAEMNDSDGCDGCTRRTLLQLVAASSLIPLGCGPSAPSTPVDSNDPDAAPDPGVMLCGNDLCIDLTQPSNSMLTTVGGSRTVSTALDRIIIIRLTATTFNTTSAVCTHQRCNVRFESGTNDMRCPCHGSRFALDGTATAPPAVRSLKVYNHTFDQASSLLTIQLA